jgi:hypothetical protein
MFFLFPFFFFRLLVSLCLYTSRNHWHDGHVAITNKMGIMGDSNKWNHDGCIAITNALGKQQQTDTKTVNRDRGTRDASASRVLGMFFLFFFFSFFFLLTWLCSLTVIYVGGLYIRSLTLTVLHAGHIFCLSMVVLVLPKTLVIILH